MEFKLKLTSMQQDQQKLHQVRRRVFIDEQNVPEELEWDEYDAVSTHILVEDKQQRAIAAARLKPDGQIGRMAVLAEYRRLGVGRAMLKALIEQARSMRLNKVYLHAQVSALGFYAKQGFSTCSEEFMEAGIAHKTMQLELTP